MLLIEDQTALSATALRRLFIPAAAGAAGWLAASATRGVVAAHSPSLRLASTHDVPRLVHVAAVHPGLTAPWALQLVVLSAVIGSIALARTLTAPAPAPDGHTAQEQARAAQIVSQWGEDSLSRFILRADKALHFAAGGVLGYRVIGATAITSGDPVGPPDSAGEILRSFMAHARENGWRVGVWGASDRHLDTYRGLGLHAVCVGEEAFVRPKAFSLEGRAVRKLRQSVNRLVRRGWQITVLPSEEIDDRLRHEIDELRNTWQAEQPHVVGYAMSMNGFELRPEPGDLYALARGPEGSLRAMMTFLAHRDRLSLDAMYRVGEVPNGLNEAMVCHALQTAAGRGVEEVSLNYAGLGHLVRRSTTARRAVRLLTWCLSHGLGRRFRMAGLVRFDEKFSPQWRGRYLVCQARLGLPLIAVRVLQAEGYLPMPRPRPHARPISRPGGWLGLPTRQASNAIGRA